MQLRLNLLQHNIKTNQKILKIKIFKFKYLKIDKHVRGTS